MPSDEKEKAALTLHGTSGIAALAPEFMDVDETMGTELVQTKIRPPFLKIVQKQSDSQLHDAFGIGAMLLSPDGILVLEPKGVPVRAIPLLFYIEYLKVAPIALKGIEPMVADRSLDPRSDIARRCMDRSLWYEDHPSHPGNEKMRYRYCEALSFIMVFQEADLPEFPFVVSFMKGSYGKGQQFCNLISMRKRPIFGCVFSLSVDPVPGKNPQGEWLRFLLTNPPDKPFVESKIEYDMLKSLHLQLKKAYDERAIETQYDTDSEEGGSVTGEY